MFQCSTGDFVTVFCTTEGIPQILKRQHIYGFACLLAHTSGRRAPSGEKNAMSKHEHLKRESPCGQLEQRVSFKNRNPPDNTHFARKIHVISSKVHLPCPALSKAALSPPLVRLSSTPQNVQNAIYQSIVPKVRLSQSKGRWVEAWRAKNRRCNNFSLQEPR